MNRPRRFVCVGCDVPSVCSMCIGCVHGLRADLDTMEQRLQELEEICSYLERERTVYLKDHRNAEFQERVIEKHRERLSWCQDYIKKQIKERKELEAELEQYKPKEDWYSE